MTLQGPHYISKHTFFFSHLGLKTWVSLMMICVSSLLVITLLRVALFCIWRDLLFLNIIDQNVRGPRFLVFRKIYLLKLLKPSTTLRGLCFFYFINVCPLNFSKIFPTKPLQSFQNSVTVKVF